MTPGRIVDAKDDLEVRLAAKVLAAGGVVAFPTETVYGLGADAFDEKAVCKIFEIKKRPSFDPLIVHVSNPEEASLLWETVPPLASKLIRLFWPGPLTIVLPKKASVPDVVTAGLSTVAVRMPKNDTALKLIRYLGRPVAAPSANLFGYTSPTTAQAVAEDLGDRVELILDGGPTMWGVESTVLKIEGDQCLLLRPGGVTVEQIEKVAPVTRGVPEKTGLQESPGLSKSHYAPWTGFTLFEGPSEALMEELTDLEKVIRERGLSLPRIGLLTFYERPKHPFFETVEVLSKKKDLYEAASNLFQAIRKLDKMHLDLIVALGTPRQGIGLAIMDRLERASSGGKGLRDFLENWKR